MSDFIPGLRLSEEFFHEAVKPVLAAHFPGLPYSAALIGSGSEVLGFDTEMSRDHHWGPRVMTFLGDADYARYHEALRQLLRNQLPRTFRGYPTSFTPPNPDGNDRSMRLLERAGFTLEGMLRSHEVCRGIPRDFHMVSLLASGWTGRERRYNAGLG